MSEFEAEIRAALAESRKNDFLDDQWVERIKGAAPKVRTAVKTETKQISCSMGYLVFWCSFLSIIMLVLGMVIGVIISVSNQSRPLTTTPLRIAPHASALYYLKESLAEARIENYQSLHLASFLVSRADFRQFHDNLLAAAKDYRRVVANADCYLNGTSYLTTSQGYMDRVCDSITVIPDSDFWSSIEAAIQEVEMVS